MALIPRVNLNADANDPAVADALEVLGIFSERFVGAATATDVVLPDDREREAFHDMALVWLRRKAIASAATVSKHNCPHVPGSEEPSWGPCTDPAYGYSEEPV